MKSNKSPKVSIILLNWNGWEDTIECLESIYKSNYPNYNVIVVDNYSQDDSIEKIESYCKGKIKISSDFFQYNVKNKPIPTVIYEEDEINYSNSNKIKFKSFNKNLTIIKNKKNYGFAKGNNIGTTYALNILNPDYIFLLNNDTVIDANSLLNLVKVGESSEEIDIIGSKMYYYNLDGQKNILWFTGGIVNFFKYPGFFHSDINLIDDENNLMPEKDCEWVSGAAMMLKVKNNSVPLLNTKYYFGCEDIDLCMNLRKKNIKIVVSLNSKIWHKVGVSREIKYGIKKNSLLSLLMERNQNIKTVLKLIHKYNPYFYLHLPLYIPKIVFSYIYVILTKLRFNYQKI